MELLGTPVSFSVLGSIPGDFKWHSRWTKCRWSRVFFGFPLLRIIPPLLCIVAQSRCYATIVRRAVSGQRLGIRVPTATVTRATKETVCCLCNQRRGVIRKRTGTTKSVTRVEAGSNTATVTLRVVRGDEKGSLESETVKYGRESHGTRTRK
jgi:hypothetical protein